MIQIRLQSTAAQARLNRLHLGAPLSNGDRRCGEAGRPTTREGWSPRGISYTDVMRPDTGVAADDWASRPATAARRRRQRFSMPMNELSRSGGSVVERERRMSAASAFVLPGAYQHVGGEEEEEEEEEDVYQFPYWWFFFICVPSFPGRLFGNALWGVIWPNALARIAGYKYKALFCAITGQIGTILGYSAPFVGALSDRLPERYAKYMGRRRPFVLAGSVFQTIGMMLIFDSLLGNGVMAKWTQHCADPGKCPARDHMNVARFAELFTGQFIKSLGDCLAGPPSSAIIPETVPVRQRGQMVAISTWFDTIVNIGGSMVGYLYGEGVTGFSEDTIWWINIANGPVSTFLVLLTFNGTAFTDCSWRGIWKPEKPPSKAVVAELKMLKEKAELKEAAANMDGDTVKWWSKVWTELKYFTSAFQDTCYRLLWIQGFIGVVGGIIQWQFGFYWYQDAFPHGYYLVAPGGKWRYKVASTAASAISIQGVISKILFVLIVPLARPDYWRDRIGGRPLLIWINILGVPLISPYVYWYFNGSIYMFTIKLFWDMWGSIIGPIAVSAGGSFMMDCLPSDERGVPLSAARDLNFHNWAWRIPETGFPLLTAYWMSTFPSHIDYFNVVFLLGGTIGNISWLMFVTVIHPRDEPLDKSFQCLRYVTNPEYREWDAKRRLGLVGPELVEKERAAMLVRNDDKLWEEEDSRQAVGARAAYGAVCCDKLAFGQHVYSAAEAKRRGESERLRRAQKEQRKKGKNLRRQHQREASAAERAPLLASGSAV